MLNILIYVCAKYAIWRLFKKIIILMDYFNYFQDFILEHYSEDGTEYENEIADLMDLRQVS